MTVGSVNVFNIKEDAVLSEICKANLEHAKQILLTENPPGQHEDLVTFSPTLFIMTKNKVYYILLDTRYAEKHKESPLEQVIPILSQFIAFNDKFGEMIAYQTVAEAWGVKGKPDKYRHGDIQKMASRKEMLLNVIQEKGKKAWTSTYEIVREVDSNNVKELKLLSEGEHDSDGLHKTPSIPTDPERIKIIKQGIHEIMDDMKMNPDTAYGFHELEEHEQDWRPNYMKKGESSA